MEKTCQVFLNYDLESNSDEINELRDVMVKRCLDIIDSVEDSCKDIFANGDDCNELINHGQAIWDTCIGDCDDQQRSEQCSDIGCGAWCMPRLIR